MKQKIFEQIRVQIKGDTEENLKKATGFVPLDRELVVRKPDNKYKYPRFRLGDGKTNVNDLPILNEQPDWNQEDPTQPDFIKNKPENLGGGLTEDEVKKIVVNETAGKYMPSVENLNKGMQGSGTMVYRIWGSNEYRKIEASQTIEGNGVVIRSNNHIIVPEDPTYNSYLQPNVATSKAYVDKKTAPIADNTKRIENLESTLLTFIEDTETAYEKDVPAGVGANAVISSIGGATKTSGNFFDPSLFGFPVNEDGSFNITANLGDFDWSEITIKVYLEPNTYYLSRKVDNVVGNFTLNTIDFYDGEGYADYITITEAQTVQMHLAYEGSGEVSADIYVMISIVRDADFEPFGVEKYGKVAVIESYGSNRFNPQWLIDNVDEYHKNNIEAYGNGLKISSYPCKTSITFAKFLELTGLKIGDTFTSVSKIIDSETGEQLISGTYNITFEHAGDGTWLDITSANVKYPKKITITEDMLKYQQLNIYMANANITPRYVLDMTITKTDTLVPYEPYSAEPIDIFNIPNEIQARNEYGKDGFILNFDNKTSIFEGNITDESAYLTDYDKFKMIAVQGGGRIRFVNEYEVAIPSEINYVKAKG